ncbi:hypothetical protein GGR52DRAFT_45760 [Hypoxylon sp. FL1284]|nr:hypothetical protein GGR52DRAFT_45760 [Hypoxylon sp. FL1284]
MPRLSYATDSSRWNAVQARDPASDGIFVYAVRTTKIYCRPVCKSRRARRANVSFYSSCQDAERAGFRPCKRCKPEVRGVMPEEAAVTRVRSMVEQDLFKLMIEPSEWKEFDAEGTGRLAQRAQVSKWHFHRIFKEITTMTPAEYAEQQKAFRPDLSVLGDNIWSGILDLPTVPNTIDTAGAQYEAPSIDIDWEALVNEDVLSLLAEPAISTIQQLEH